MYYLTFNNIPEDIIQQNSSKANPSSPAKNSKYSILIICGTYFQKNELWRLASGNELILLL